MDQARIVDHSVHLYYEFSYEFPLDSFDNDKCRNNIDEQIKQATVNAGADACIKLLARKSGKTMWQPLGGGDALCDLEPHMQAILGGDAKICLAYKLATTDLVSKYHSLGEHEGKKVTKKKNWRIQYTAAAKKRSGMSSVELQINEIRLFVFRSGVALLEVTVKYQGRVTQALLLESNYALTHDHKQGECPVGTVHGGDLRDLAAALVPTVANFRPQAIKGRVNVYTIAKLESNPGVDALRGLGMRLAQRQTSDYLLLEENTQHHCLTPFSNLCHAAAVEGGASLVAMVSDQGSSFIDRFVTATGRKTYLPIYIYQLHNHYWLLNHLRGISREGSAGGAAEDVRLDQKLESIVDFRRYFQFSQISQISAHNSFHDLWQRELKAEERFRHLNEAATTIGEHVRERRTRWVSHVTATVGGYLLGSGLMENLSKVVPMINLPNLLLENLGDITHRERLRQLSESWDMAIVCAGLLIAAGSFYLSWRFHRKAEY